jgi:hypothetical protein
MNKAIGRDWEEIEKEIFTPEEIAEAELKASIISKQIKAENEKKLSKRTLEELRVYSLGYTSKTPDKS